MQVAYRVDLVRRRVVKWEKGGCKLLHDTIFCGTGNKIISLRHDICTLLHASSYLTLVQMVIDLLFINNLANSYDKTWGTVWSINYNKQANK